MNQRLENPRFASVIKKLRATNVLTQEHLAQLAEVDVRTIQRLESTGICSKETLMAIAEAFDMDAKDLQKSAQQSTETDRDLLAKFENLLKEELILVTLHEVIGPKDLINSFAGCHAQMQDFPDDLTAEQAELVGHVLDYLHDYADIQNDVYPSERIRMMQDVKAKLDKLKATGLTAFVGSFTRRLITKGKPEDPFEWTSVVISLRSANDKRILAAENGSKFTVVAIPKANATPGRTL